MKQPSPILLVAAAEFELAALRDSLQKSLREDIDYAMVGIGAIHAAKNAERVAEKARGRKVIFVGTAGIFGKFSTVKLMCARQVLWMPACERANIAYSIPGLHPPIDLPAPPSWVADLELATVVCGPTISKTALLSTELPEKLQQPVVENLELYSCIAEIMASAQETVILLGITNAIGPDAHQQWKKNHPLAAKLTAEYCVSHMKESRP